MHTLAVGGYRCTCLRDTPFWVDGGALFHMTPRPVWMQHLTPDAENRIALALNILLVQGHGRTLLLDAGVGTKLPAREAAWYKLDSRQSLTRALAGAGVSPEEVDTVILTHLHLDHAGGLTCQDGEGVRPVFRHARHFVQRAEWEAACHPNELTTGSYCRDDFLPIREADAWTFLEGDADIAPGISVHLTRAHSHGHQALCVTDGGETLFCPGDLLPSPWHMRLAWVTSYDLWPYDVVEERKRWLAQADQDGWRLFLSHTPAEPFGTVSRRDGRAFVWKALEGGEAERAGEREPAPEDS